MVSSELDRLLKELAETLPIITEAKPLDGPRPGVIAHLSCGHNHETRANSEQVQIAPRKNHHTQVDCVASLRELLLTKRASPRSMPSVRLPPPPPLARSSRAFLAR